MNTLGNSEVAPTALKLIQGAVYSVDFMAFEGHPLFFHIKGVPLEDIITATKERLNLRGILGRPNDLSGNLEALEANRLGISIVPEEQQNGPWKIRITPLLPSAHMLIVDHSIALFMDLSTMDLSMGPSYRPVHIITDLAELDGPLQLFESAWSGTPRLLYQDNFHLSGEKLGSVIEISDTFWKKLISELAQDPRQLYSLQPRKFEELVAALLHQEGMEVQLTPPSKDGGRDVLASLETPIGKHLFYVECKRYSPHRPVDVRIVRELFGVVEAERATAGMIVTTSRFTRAALEFRETIRHRLELKDYEQLCGWLNKHADSRAPNPRLQRTADAAR